MKCLLFLAVLIPALCGSSITHAQGKKKKEKEEEQKKTPVFNYVIEDPMDVFGRSPDAEKPLNVRFPDFYSYTPKTDKDTTYKYECYDRKDVLINVDTLHDINAVRFISVFKSYNHPTQTYVDKNGQEQPLPMSSIIRRYDKAGDNKWMSIDYATNKYTQLKELKGEITRTEKATFTNPATGARQNVELWYYRVIANK